MYIIRGTKRTNDEQRTQGEKKERKKMEIVLNLMNKIYIYSKISFFFSFHFLRLFLLLQ